MNSSNQRAVHEIVTGRKIGNDLHTLEHVGVAFLYPDNAHFVLKLRSMPERLLYLRRNPNSMFHYTIFGRCLRSSGVAKYGYPMGSGRLANELKTHLELTIPALQARLFLNLYPRKQRERRAA